MRINKDSSFIYFNLLRYTFHFRKNDVILLKNKANKQRQFVYSF